LLIETVKSVYTRKLQGARDPVPHGW